MNNTDILKQANVIIASQELNPDYAYLYGINVKDDSIDLVEISHYWESYAMLGDPENKVKIQQYQYALILTNGWAISYTADQEDDNLTRLAPSEHPDRLRVSLRALYSPDSGFATSVYIENNPEPMYDTQGNGMLADAIMALFDNDKVLLNKTSVDTLNAFVVDDEDADLFQ